MNIFGKVLVVVIFLLSIGFAVAQMILFTERTQYREMYEDSSAKLNRTEGRLGETERDLEELRTEFDNFRGAKRREIENLESEIEGKETDIMRLQRDREEQSAQLTKAQQNKEALIGNLNRKDEIIEQHESRIAELDERVKERMDEIDGLEENISEQRALVNEKRNNIARLEEEKENALTRLQDRERQLAELEARGVHVDIIAPLPPIDGHLSRVDNEIGVAIINRGSDHGVEINFDFVVYRENDFVARLYVMDVYPNHALARVDRDVTDLQEQPMEVGDNVTTRIR